MTLMINDIDSLKKELSDHKVDTSNWGKGNAKTVENLLTELTKNDCVLVKKDNQLHRTVCVLFVIIMSNGLILMEKEQILVDGRTRKRSLPLAEKVIVGEDLINATRRAIQEELEFIDNSTEPLAHSFEIMESSLQLLSSESKESASYPNLICMYETYMIKVKMNDLPKNEFSSFEKREGGYQITKWQWIEIDAAKKMNDDIKTYFDK
jgi:hypothetical protein